MRKKGIRPVATHCPACGMAFADPKHTLTSEACRDAVASVLQEGS